MTSEDRARTVRDAAGLPRLHRAAMTAEAGGMAEAHAHLSRHDSPDVLILETAEDPEALVESLDRLADVVRPGTKVILLGDSNDIALYRRLLSMGVSEYLYGSVTPDELLDAVQRIASTDGEQAGGGRVIAVFGTAGGVGTSTVAVNVADAIAARGDESVVLVDLDLWFGVDALALNLTPRQGAADALSDPNRIDDMLLDRVLEKHGDGVQVLAAPASPEVAAPPTEEALEKLLAVLRRKMDVVVLDLPRLWTPWVKTALIEARETVLVTYPDLANLRNTRSIVDVVGPARAGGAPRIVFNRAGLSRKNELTAGDYSEALGRAPDAVLPFEPALCASAMNQGQTLRQAGRTNALTRAIGTLADTVDPPAGKGAGKGRPRLSLKTLFTHGR
ncbi:CpaE family protein [Caenispirillum salinarum]|uniref:AAA family ATPase n=1 Tax=Caenispirillum salinarum TaxID=859058 RepID=UPI0038510682